MFPPRRATLLFFKQIHIRKGGGRQSVIKPEIYLPCWEREDLWELMALLGPLDKSVKLKTASILRLTRGADVLLPRQDWGEQKPSSSVYQTCPGRSRSV